MATAKSNYLENKLIEHVLTNTGYTSPTNVYLALHTSNPNEDDSGAEVSGGSYARQTMSFAAASNGACATDTTLSFTVMPAATVTHIGIYDALTTGNLLYYGELTSPLTVTAGSTVSFASGDITVTET